MSDDRTTVADLDDYKTVYTTPGGSVVHTDRQCPQTHNSKTVPSKARVLDDDRDVCLRCLGEHIIDDSRNPRATANALEAMNPEDLGLSPLGDSPGGRSV